MTGAFEQTRCVKLSGMFLGGFLEGVGGGGALIGASEVKYGGWDVMGCGYRRLCWGVGLGLERRGWNGDGFSWCERGEEGGWGVVECKYRRLLGRGEGLRGGGDDLAVASEMRKDCGMRIRGSGGERVWFSEGVGVGVVWWWCIGSNGWSCWWW